jgi:hypothetical protein
MTDSFAILFHADFSNQAEMTNFMKNIAIEGSFALDHRATQKVA